MRNRLLIALFALCAPMAMAQNISFTCEAPLSVTAGQRFQVQFVLRNGEGSTFSPPKFDGLDVLAGPTMSAGQQVQITNGVQKSESYESYIYFVQASSSVSKAAISVASISTNGKRYSTKPVAIDILAGGGASSGSSGSGSGRGGVTHMKPSAGLAAGDVLLRMELSKTSAYKGEAVSAQLKLYTRAGIAGLDKPKYPAFNGLWTQEIAVPTNAAPTRATIGGKTYEGHVLRQWLLYPQKSGVTEIEQASFTAYVQVVTQSNDVGSLFDSFFGGSSSVQNVEKALASPSVKLTVKALPTSNMPIGFSLAVGKFDLKSEISSTQIATNAAGSVKITLTGTGDFPLIEAPVLAFPAGIEQYDVKMTEKIRNSLSGTSGERTWEFPFVARSEGDFEIPSVEIPYFDPSAGVYKTLRSEPYKLHVVRDSTSHSGAAVMAGVSKEELKLLEQDLRYIKTAPTRLAPKGRMWLYSGTFFMTLIVIVASFIALLWFLRRQINLRSDVVGRKHRRASRVALRRLKNAKGFMTLGDRAGFFEAMLSAMWGFVGDKFAMEVSELSKERIAQQFSERGYSDELSSEFLSIVDDCEVARYAPASSVDMTQVYDRALTLFDAL